MRSPAIAAALLLALGATGCSADVEPDDSANENQPSASASDTSDPVEDTPASTDGASEAGTPDASAAALGEPATSRTSSDQGNEIELAVYPITRSGELAVLNFTLTLPASAQAPYSLSNTFDDRNADASDSSPFTVDGVQVTDPVNGKLYLAASDGDGNCVCTNVLGAAVAPGDTRALSVTYAAPPTDVTTVNVNFPLFGTVTDVPVE